jgi:hypothetical protein
VDVESSGGSVDNGLKVDVEVEEVDGEVIDDKL